MLFELFLLLILMTLCSFAPGFFFVRHLPWTPSEKFCGSVGLSLILLYLAVWGIFCFGPYDQHIAYWAVAAAALGLGAAAWKDAVRLFRTFRVKQALAWFGILLAFTFLMLSIIRVYSGAGWRGDWFEHFHRSLFFLNRFPLQTPMFPGYAMPARPPMMNVLAAYFLGLTEDRFEVCQVAFAFLNLLMFFPCLLIGPMLGVTRKRSVMPLAVLFAASPVVMEELTYTWTKAFAVFFIVLALAFYLSGLRKNDPGRVLAAFIAISAGVLVHYSAGPYILFLTLAYTVRLVRRRKWGEALLIGTVCGLLLLTWFGWSAAEYGWKTTLASNTSVTSSEAYRGSNWQKIGVNLVATIVPVWLRGGLAHFSGSRGFPVIRDYAFVFYQLNLIFAMGIFGGPLVLYLLARTFQRRAGKPRERRFWTMMIPFCILVGIAVVGELDINGLAHLTLLPIQILGLTLLAARFFDMSRAVRLLLVAGCLIDFYFGVFLQARVEGMENTPGRVYYVDNRELPTAGQPDPAALPEAVSADSWKNWQIKHRYHLAEIQLVTIPEQYSNGRAFPESWPGIRTVLQGILTDDATNWGGWMQSHGGTAKYLGDWVGEETGAGTDAALALFAVFFAGLVAVLLKSALQAKAPPHAATVAARAPAVKRPAAARKRR